MSLISFSFVIFVILVLLFYYFVPKKYSYIVLLLSSIFFLFYNSFSLMNLFFVLIIFLISYFCGLAIEKYKENKSILITGILLILLILIYLKYTNLFIVTLNSIFGFSIALVDRASPLGISYYSLIMIGYLISIYWNSIKPQKNPLKTLLFMSYFPILTSGPFINYEEINNGLYNKNKFKLVNIIDGILRISWGFFKIFIISNRLNIYVNSVYSNLESYNGIYIIGAIIAFTFQLYTNFSGSIDIIMGVSKMFGITLPENFNNPFASQTITEFWRRWHITLGNWLKNYIFYPLLKSKWIQKLTNKCKEKYGKNGKKIPLYLSMLILWIIIGIWHGGEYKYILATGILQFIFLFVEDITGAVNKNSNGVIKIIRILRTFLLFSFAMVFFRAESISNGIEIIKHIFMFNGNLNLINTGINYADLIVLFLSIVTLLFIDNRLDIDKDYIYKRKILFKTCIIFSLIILILVFGVYGIGFNVTDFIYSKF